MEQVSKSVPGKRGGKRGGAYERYLKKRGARIMRRQGKGLLEDAPRRLAYRGYSD